MLRKNALSTSKGQDFDSSHLLRMTSDGSPPGALSDFNVYIDQWSGME